MITVLEDEPSVVDEAADAVRTSRKPVAPDTEPDTLDRVKSLEAVVRHFLGWPRRRLASYDPAQRRRIRHAVKQLVPDDAYGDPGAVTPNEIARLALLRLLYLQREIHRSGRLRQTEAAATLTRLAIETCIVGLYCLSDPDAARKFDGEAVKRLKPLFADLASNIDVDLIGPALEHFGTDTTPVVAKMLDPIRTSGHLPGVKDLYVRYYLPLSSLYVHAGPLALLRHTTLRDNKTRQQPYRTWTAYSATNTADTMLSILASAVSGQDHPNYERFLAYGNLHWRQARPPIYYGLGGMLLRANLKELPRLIGLLRQLVASARAGNTFTEEQVDRLMQSLSRLLQTDPTDEASSKVSQIIRSYLLDFKPGQSELLEN